MAGGFEPAAIDFGAGTLYVAPIGTPEPLSITGALNAAFVGLGYTDSGHVFTSGLTATPINAAESYYTLINIVTAKDTKCSMSLMQITAANLSTAFNGGTITAVGGGGGVTYDPPAPGTEVRCMLYWKSLDGTEAWIGRQCFQTAASAITRSKTAAAMIPVEFDFELPALTPTLQPWRWFGAAANRTS